jgi:hypothetical protein
MSKHKPERSNFKIRELPPQLRKTREGMQVLCPFCEQPHPLLPGIDSPCGTTLKVTAVQTILTSHAAKQGDIFCLKCGKTGGEMIHYMNGWIHLVDCDPSTKLLNSVPKLSRMAKIVYRMPRWLQKPIEKHTGRAQEVQEIDPDGKKTGKILGYFFWSGKVDHGKHS